jgi:hypothetical protein
MGCWSTLVLHVVGGPGVGRWVRCCGVAVGGRWWAVRVSAVVRLNSGELAAALGGERLLAHLRPGLMFLAELYCGSNLVNVGGRLFCAGRHSFASVGEAVDRELKLGATPSVDFGKHNLQKGRPGSRCWPLRAAS